MRNAQEGSASLLVQQMRQDKSSPIIARACTTVTAAAGNEHALKAVRFTLSELLANC